jgi:inorganic pyrophosphatase
MGLWNDLSPGENAPDEINVVVEILKNSRQRFNLQGHYPKLEGIFTSLAYPTDCGFIPRTSWESGKPIESLILVEEATFPGCVVQARPIGVLKILGADEKRSDKILSVPLADPKYEKVLSMGDLSPHIGEDITHFFTTFRQSLGARANFEIMGWGDAVEAKRIIQHGIKVFSHKGKNQAVLEREENENV